MDNTESTNLQPGDDGAYGAMAQAAQASVPQLLLPFKASSAEDILRKSSVEAFFQKFILHADQFTDRCCQDFARIMRQYAVVPMVRGTPTGSLAKEIRKEVFEPLDTILASYFRDLNQLGLDLGAVSAELRENSILDASMKGAAVGQMAGGFGSSGKTLGALNALAQAAAEGERKLELLQHRAELLRKAEAMAFPRILEYLKAVKAMPDRLLDFGCAKVFGGQVSFLKQQESLKVVEDAITKDLDSAIQLAMLLPEAAKRVEQQQLKDAKGQELERAWRQQMLSKRRSPGEGLALIAGSIGFVVWGVTSCQPDTTSEGNMVWCGILFMSGLGALIFGIMKFFDRRPRFVKERDQVSAGNQTLDERMQLHNKLKRSGVAQHQMHEQVPNPPADLSTQLSPFTKVRFDADKVFATYLGKELELVAINYLSAAAMLDFCRLQYGATSAENRFAEDLVIVLSEMGHPTGPDHTVALTLADPGTGEKKNVEHAAMTLENRQAVSGALHPDQK